MNLGPEHFPIPCSLAKLVEERYGSLATPPPADEQAMSVDEVLEYLKTISNLHLTPLEGILEQTEAIGDPALPTAKHSAILQWLGTALLDWEQRFPLEEPLASQLRALKPLTAALAITAPDFLQPGAHPIHHLLDTVQARAVGWQPRLGRAGQALEQQVGKAITGAMAWFDNRNTDLTTICAELAAVAERDQERANRMAQRVAETELGRVKTADAKLQAGLMINAALEEYPAPQEIGDFLKGPWFTSAQLVILKCGVDSQQWKDMSATTDTLLDSLQAPQDDQEDSRRQHLFEVVTQLPKDMRRWLLSLHHDTEAVNDAMGLVEFAHLRVLRRQPLELKLIDPIATVQESESEGQRKHFAVLEHIETGQWFRVDTGDADALRVQMVFRLEAEQELLFTNQAGIKVLQLSYQEFSDLIEQQKATPLHSGASFSQCLAKAAGIASVEALQALTESATESSLQDQAAGRQQEEERLRLQREQNEAAQREQQQLAETQRLEQEREQAQRQEQEQAEQQRLEREREEAQRLEWEQQEIQRLQQEREQEEAQRLEREKEEAQRLEREQEEAQRLEREQEEAQRLEREQEEAQRLEREQEEAQRLEREQEEAQRLEREEAERVARQQEIAERQRREEEQALQDKLEREEAAQAEAEEQAKIEEYQRQKQDSLQQQHATPEQNATAPDETTENTFPHQAANEATSGASQEVVLNLPMGAWLGFHDGDTPLMAKLAVHDREQDHYIFVNREGIKMRQLSKQELLRLMDDGLVDILQTNSNFRDEVTHARNRFEQ